MSRFERLSAHFMRYEFECSGVDCCNHSSPISQELIKALEILREQIEREVGFEPFLTINSGFRCNKHNKKIGGSVNSQHTLGLAADIKDKYNRVEPILIADIASEIEPFKSGGIGVYDTFAHVDIRKERARWDERTK